MSKDERKNRAGKACSLLTLEQFKDVLSKHTDLLTIVGVQKVDSEKSVIQLRVKKVFGGYYTERVRLVEKVA